MKKYVLQALLVLFGFLVVQGCSDDDNDVDLTEVNAAAAAVPSKVFFAREATQAAVVQLSVAISEKTPEIIGFEVRVADDSGISADKVTFSKERFNIEAGKRSFELTCTVEADAVWAGETKLLKVDFMSQNSKIGHIKLEVPVEAEKEEEPEDPEPENTIVYVADFQGTVDMGDLNWLPVELNEGQVCGFFQTAVVIGSASAAKRIHLDNYGGDVIGSANGDLIHIAPLEEGAVIGEGADWVTNPEYSSDNWMYMPVLYSAAHTEWAGKTAYAGLKLWIGDKWCNAWFKITVSAEGECEVDGWAYDAWGHDIKAGQTVSEK